ncbi:MAG: hypothetical protein LBK72_02995 [Bifidobacteriaceae bacterium]|jgi:hypothetical protein|nr:hypothetical protein [Bifidobacteriaceae bacterium]
MDPTHEHLMQAVTRDLGAPETWIDIHTYPDSMAECLIDAVWSERVRYSVIEGIINRYRAYRAGSGADADHDSARDLLGTFSMGLDAWMDTIGNRQRAYSRGEAPFKAVLVRMGARAAVACGIVTAQALRHDHSRDSSSLNDLKTRWFQLPAQHSGLTWERLLLVAGVDDVPSDGWIIEYVSRVEGLPGTQTLSPAEVTSIVEAAAKDLGVSPLRLRNAIWRFETTRDRAIGYGPRASHPVRAGATAGQGAGA